VLVEGWRTNHARGCKRFEDGEKAAAEKINVAGHEGHQLRRRRQKAVRHRLQTVAEDWVKDVNKRGKPGTEVFKAFTTALAAGH